MDDKDLAYAENGMSDADREAALVERKGSMLGEAAAMYGDVATAEEYGYVHRALKARQIQFIALGGAIGTGLFLGISQSLVTAGPLGILLGYSITGLFIYCMMMSLGEMATWLPMPGAIPQYCTRYVDSALGFAVGWNQWYSLALSQCAELTAAATLISYWEDPNNIINPAAWISILIVVIVSLNVFAVSIYGEAEFWFASIKLVTIVGLLILAFIVDLGGSPRHHRLGFQYWHSPGAMPALPPSTGDWGRFLSFFTVLINAAFSYGGVEIVAVAAGEAEDPRRNIPKAINRTLYRILVFYVLGSLAIGVMVPYDNSSIATSTGTASSSPWVVGIQLAQIDVLPSIINAVILTSATSSGNAFLYSGSRYLFALAQNGQAPRIFLKCSRRGLPYVCVLFTAMFSALSYLAVGSSSSTVFNWFLNLTTIANLWTWVGICWASLGFRAALKAQGVKDSDLPFKAPFQPHLARAAMGFFLIVIFFNGFHVFTTGNWDVSKFITAYIGVPIFLALYGFWKVFKRTPFVKPESCDLWTGKAAIDSEYWPERKPRNFIERVWFWIA